MAKSAIQILKERDQGISARQNIETYWQTVHDMFDNVGDDVNTVYTPGTELTITQLYDSYTLETSDVLASGLQNYLTPAASRWYGLRTRDPLKMEKKRVLHYMKDVEAEVTHTLNTSNFYDTIPNFYKKSGDYGTSILFQEEDPFDKVRFYSLPMKNIVIVNDSRGRVSEYWIDFEYTASQAVDRFGLNKVHKEVAKQHVDGRDPNKKAIYTFYIGKNWNRDERLLDNTNKPWISQWIDNAHKTEIQRGGFDELPALTHRFYTRSGQAWGFSPAMKALMDGRLLSTKAKTLMRAEMKNTDPAIALPDNAFLNPYNGNPRGTNFYKAGSLSEKSIFEIGNGGNVIVGQDSIEYTKARIRSLMFTDVFRAFEGITKQMNNPEVYEKITEKMTLLGPAVGRFITVMDQTIHRTIALLDRQGMLPEPPPEILEDPNYEIDYLSTLAKAQRNPELNAMQNALQMTAGLATFDPAVMDKIDPDKGVDAIWGITGAPIQMLRDDDEVAGIRGNRAKMEQAQQQADMMAQGADVALKGTQAGRNVAESQAVGA